MLKIDKEKKTCQQNKIDDWWIELIYSVFGYYKTQNTLQD